MTPDPRYPDPALFTLVQGDGEWSALYYDGVLAERRGYSSGVMFPVYGDHYVVQEALCSLLGIEMRQTENLTDPAADRNSPLRGVAPLLTVLDERDTEQEAKRARALELREQAKALEAEAAVLEREAR